MHSELRFQFDWRGNAMQNLRILVCRRCEDVPQPQLRPIIVGPDPYPVRDPRPGFAAYQQGQQPPVQTPLEIITDDEGIGNSVFPPLPPNFGLFNNGGILGVSSPNYWPTNTVGMDHPGLASYGLAPGDLWSLRGVANVIPGNTPDPSAPLVFFGQINSFQLLQIGGKNLPLSDPGVLNALWNNHGVVWISGLSGLYDDGGVLALSDATGWPTNSSGTPGSLWSNGEVASVVPGGAPVAAPPVIFGFITSAGLLAMGGLGLPVTQPATGSLQLWNSGGEIWIA